MIDNTMRPHADYFIWSLAVRKFGKKTAKDHSWLLISGKLIGKDLSTDKVRCAIQVTQSRGQEA